jgi:hypothetical protein
VRVAAPDALVVELPPGSRHMILCVSTEKLWTHFGVANPCFARVRMPSGPRSVSDYIICEVAGLFVKLQREVWVRFAEKGRTLLA